MDNSQLDNKYFIDEYKYNCPFCNRRHVSYYISNQYEFNWNSSKQCYAYFIKCESCNNTSFHLSFIQIPTQNYIHTGKKRFNFFSTKKDDSGDETLIIDLNNKEIDELFFYSVPTSFFSIDTRIPKLLRELLTEAEGCLKSNYLTGASVCVRKVIYELAVLEGAEGENYDDRIKSLKTIKKDVEPSFFDTLLTIQQVTSAKVHEQSYDGWQSKHLRLILSTLNEILHEIYVIPSLRQEKRKAILDLKKEVIGGE